MARITLKDIAQEAGVSIATVSLALRGRGKLSPNNVARIAEIAKRMGYTPNPMLAALASRRFRAGEQPRGIPLALLEFPPFEGDNKRAVLYQKYLIEHAQKLGYSPQVYSLYEMQRYRDFTRVLFHRGTQAAVITGQPHSETFIENKHWNHFAMVQCGRYQTSLPVHNVRPNIFQAVKKCFDEVYSRGYRRIGFAIGHHQEILEDDQARRGAALSLIEQYLLASNRIPPYFKDPHDRPRVIDWIKKYKPDVCIGFGPDLWYALKDAGIQCPQDMGFATLHNDTFKDAKQFSGLDQSHDEIARQSILLIDQMVRNNERGLTDNPLNILIPSKWIEGDSLRSKEK